MKSKGFTLIEMMIVFAIIGILTAVAYPAITGKKPQSTFQPVDSQSTTCIQQ